MRRPSGVSVGKRQRRLLIHSNAGGGFGMGHLMRCLALVEEALARGWDVRWGGDLDGGAMEYLRIHSRDVAVESCPLVDMPRWLADQTALWHPDVLHLDTYSLRSDEIPRGSHLVSAMQDGEHGEITADLAIDGNLGAEDRFLDRGLSRAYLLGAAAIAVRHQVLAQRGVPWPADGYPKVLVVLGGTDPLGLTTTVVAALTSIAKPIAVTVVTPASQRSDIERIVAGSHHRFDLAGFIADLPAEARRHHLVISAAGTSVWDFACMGVPMALLGVVDNQRDGYVAAVGAGIALGLGLCPAFDSQDLKESMRSVESLLFDAARLRAMSERGRAVVDGLGAWRIVGSWEQLLDIKPDRDGHQPELHARPATLADAELLHCWRNDDGTRRASRSSAEIPWVSHLGWLADSLSRDDRQLLIVNDGADQVGTIRWDFLGGRDWEISITVAPEFRGRGLATSILRAGERGLKAEGTVRLWATIREGNAASRKAFDAARYLPHLPTDDAGFLVVVRWRTSGSHRPE